MTEDSEGGADGLAGEPESVRREIGVAGAGLCCCVLVNSVLVDERHVIVCTASTTGPDDPFCEDCEDRHVSHPAVIVGLTKATQRLRGPGGGGGAG